MTALKRTVGSVTLVLIGALAGCSGNSFFEIPIEIPIAPKLDTTPFQRLLVAGFIAGGSDEVDGNLETVRLLRSQLRTKSAFRVVDADPLPLLEVAAAQGIALASRAPANDATPPDPADADPDDAEEAADADKGPTIREEADLDAFDGLFANVDYWKRIGEEHQQPLIVTGTILFAPHQRSGFVQREQEVYDSFGRRRTVPTRTYQERVGFVLRPTFIFIDGRTGETLHTETFREEVLYSINQATPALSSYFELMDRLLPTFLNTLTAQKIRGTRVLLK